MELFQQRTQGGGGERARHGGHSPNGCMIAHNIIVSGEAILNPENGGKPLGSPLGELTALPSPVADGEGACCPPPNIPTPPHKMVENLWAVRRGSSQRSQTPSLWVGRGLLAVAAPNISTTLSAFGLDFRPFDLAPN